jgi:hypothetical protein
MSNSSRHSLYGVAVALGLSALGLFAISGEARNTYCKEYQTTVLIRPSRPVRAIGKVCLVNGKWYLTSFDAATAGR